MEGNTTYAQVLDNPKAMAQVGILQCSKGWLQGIKTT